MPSPGPTPVPVGPTPATGGGVVLVHDYLLVRRGAERTFEALAALWPGAPVATLFFDEGVWGPDFTGREVRTSALQRLGVSQATFKRLMPLLPAAAERLDVRGAGLVVSSSSAYAHGVRPDPGAVHVCYCHTPFRYAWYETENGVLQAPRPLRPLVRRALARARRWDHAQAQRPTRYVANSRLTQDRVRCLWGRDAEVVHPPVAIERFAPGSRGDAVLLVGELVRHKRMELALAAARRAGVPVQVVGEGADRERLEALHPEVRFLGRVGDLELARLYGSARALVMPNAEEFGITAVEAQASGCPVVAVDAGGAQETVRDGETGFLVAPGDADALAEVLSDRTALAAIDPAACVRNAERFSTAAFQRGMAEQVQRALDRVARGEAPG